MFIRSHQLSRRRLLALTAAGAVACSLSSLERAKAGVTVVNCPYFAQGGTGSEENSNCGPTTVSMALNFSGASNPSPASVRAALGTTGGTNIGQWAWLLDYYGAAWYSTWSKAELDTALSAGHVVVMAAWMGNLSAGSDFMASGTPNKGFGGRYDDFNAGHAMLIVGASDGWANYLVHDPNVFPGDPTDYYADGTPKGAYRRYDAGEIWATMQAYSGGLGLAVLPPDQRDYTANGQSITGGKGQSEGGPGGGHAPRRGSHDLGAAASMGQTSTIADDDEPEDPFANTNG